MQLLCKRRDSTIGLDQSTLAGFCISRGLSVGLELRREVIANSKVEDDGDEQHGRSKVPCALIVAGRKLSTADAVASNQAHSCSSVVSEAECAGAFSGEEIVGRAIDELVVLPRKLVLLLSRFMHVFDEGINVISDFSQVLLVLWLRQAVVMPVLQERGDGMDPVVDLLRAHERISAAQPEDRVRVKAELAARGSAWFQVV